MRISQESKGLWVLGKVLEGTGNITKSFKWSIKLKGEILGGKKV